MVKSFNVDVDASYDDGIDVIVTVRYTPGRPAMRGRNGDPGDPPDSPEYEVIDARFKNEKDAVCSREALEVWASQDWVGTFEAQDAIEEAARG